MTPLTNVMFDILAKELGIESALLKAVKLVESGNKDGFNVDGSPQILFEGHVFYKYISKKFDPKLVESYCKQYPNIVYKSWDNSKYYGGANEHKRLQQATKIDRESALMATSWGMFQVMGFNYKSCGCDTLQEFINKMYDGPVSQMRLMIGFLKNNSSGGKTLLQLLKEHNWAAFARGYNGPGYAKNAYDQKLRNAYNNYSRLK